ncbi:hypothetical protein FRC06_005644 [Ceratobasidium sp. 370]|nr:hypothetical protein FRC06_005644 [Ceratobasidium sp. 370]
MKLPSKELLTLMDLWAVGGVGGRTIESLGHNTSDFRHIPYSNYNKIINEYRVILRGYPLTPDGNIVRPSDFPGGIKGLMHADEQLASGTWGFEKISDVAYKEWVSKCGVAEDGDEDMPDPPYIPVPGTEFRRVPPSDNVNVAEGSHSSRKRKANTEACKEHAAKQLKAGKNGGKAAAKGKVKSREIIEESASESGGELEKEESEEESGEEESGEEELGEEESEGSSDS